MTVHINGVDNLVGKFQKLGKLNVVRAYMRAAASYIKNKFETVPPTRRITRESVYGAPFQSDKQRRFFFAALADGTIEVPYHRGESAGSEAMNRSWTTKEENDGMTQIIGNDTSYGPFVMGEKQSLFMQAIGWRKANDIVEEETEQVVAKITSGLEAELAEVEE